MPSESSTGGCWAWPAGSTCSRRPPSPSDPDSDVAPTRAWRPLGRGAHSGVAPTRAWRRLGRDAHSGEAPIRPHSGPPPGSLRDSVRRAFKTAAVETVSDAGRPGRCGAAPPPARDDRRFDAAMTWPPGHVTQVISSYIQILPGSLPLQAVSTPPACAPPHPPCRPSSRPTLSHLLDRVRDGRSPYSPSSAVLVRTGRPALYGPRSRPALYGPRSRPALYGPLSRPALYGPRSRPALHEPLSRPALYGPGPACERGPGARLRRDLCDTMQAVLL
jgi:hypothetical protein